MVAPDLALGKGPGCTGMSLDPADFRRELEAPLHPPDTDTARLEPSIPAQPLPPSLPHEEGIEKGLSRER